MQISNVALSVSSARPLRDEITLKDLQAVYHYPQKKVTFFFSFFFLIHMAFL
jgi:hypothetical protein